MQKNYVKTQIISFRVLNYVIICEFKFKSHKINRFDSIKKNLHSKKYSKKNQNTYENLSVETLPQKPF